MIYMVADTETTDATDERGVCELGWIVIDENWNIVERVESLIDPQRPISPSASGVHGLTNEDVADAPTMAEFFGEVYGKRIQGPVVLIGHRIGFDRPAFEPFVDGEIYELDTLRFVRWLYPDMGDHKLSTCIYALNLPRDSGAAHRVMADVLTAYHLAKHIAERLNVTLPELVARAQEPLPVHTLPFGKHRGELIETIPKSYLRWLINSDMQLDSDYMHTINAILNNKP
jgi:exodeoxyribonuclease X